MGKHKSKRDQRKSLTIITSTMNVQLDAQEGQETPNVMDFEVVEFHDPLQTTAQQLQEEIAREGVVEAEPAPVQNFRRADQRPLDRGMTASEREAATRWAERRALESADIRLEDARRILTTWGGELPQEEQRNIPASKTKARLIAAEEKFKKLEEKYKTIISDRWAHLNDRARAERDGEMIARLSLSSMEDRAIKGITRVDWNGWQRLENQKRFSGRSIKDRKAAAIQDAENLVNNIRCDQYYDGSLFGEWETVLPLEMQEAMEAYYFTCKYAQTVVLPQKQIKINRMRQQMSVLKGLETKREEGTPMTKDEIRQMLEGFKDRKTYLATDPVKYNEKCLFPDETIALLDLLEEQLNVDLSEYREKMIDPETFQNEIEPYMRRMWETPAGEKISALEKRVVIASKQQRKLEGLEEQVKGFGGVGAPQIAYLERTIAAMEQAKQRIRDEGLSEYNQLMISHLNQRIIELQEHCQEKIASLYAKQKENIGPTATEAIAAAQRELAAIRRRMKAEEITEEEARASAIRVMNDFDYDAEPNR